MNARTFDRSKVRSRDVTVGPTRAPHRSYDYAMGLTEGRYMIARLDGGPLHEDCPTVTGKTSEQSPKNVKFNTKQRVVYPVSNPISALGGVVGLKGSLAPEGAIVKVAGMTKLAFKGPARCFDREEDAFATVKAGTIEDGDIVAIDADSGTPVSRGSSQGARSTPESLEGAGQSLHDHNLAQICGPGGLGGQRRRDPRWRKG